MRQSLDQRNKLCGIVSARSCAWKVFLSIIDKAHQNQSSISLLTGSKELKEPEELPSFRSKSKRVLPL